MSLRKNASGQLIKTTSGALIKNCACCGSATVCKCLPTTPGIVRSASFNSNLNERYTEMIGGTSGGGAYTFEYPWVDFTTIPYSYAYDNNTISERLKYTPMPWHTDPQKMEYRVTVSGTSTDILPHATSADGPEVTWNCKFEFRCRYVNYFGNESTNEADYYRPDGAFPATDYIHSGNGWFEFPFQNDDSNSVGLAKYDATVNGTWHGDCVYTRSTGSFKAQWVDQTYTYAGNTYRLLAGIQYFNYPQTPNNTVSNLNFLLTNQIQKLVGADWVDDHTLTFTLQNVQRYTVGHLAQLDNEILTLEVPSTFYAGSVITRDNPYGQHVDVYGGEWNRVVRIGSVDTSHGSNLLLISAAFGEILELWTFSVPTPSGPLEVYYPAELWTEQELSFDWYIVTHSYFVPAHNVITNHKASKSTSVSENFNVTASTIRDNGLYTNSTYPLANYIKDVTMTYPGGEDLVPKTFTYQGTDYPVVAGSGDTTIPFNGAPLTWTPVAGADLVGIPMDVFNIILADTGNYTISETEIVGDNGQYYYVLGLSIASETTTYGVSTVFNKILTITFYYAYDNYSSTEYYGSGETYDYPYDITTMGPLVPNPIKLKITSTSSLAGYVVDNNDEVTQFSIDYGATWQAINTGNVYISSQTGYPASIDYAAGSASTADTSIEISYIDGATIIGTGTISSHFSGNDASAGALETFMGCPFPFNETIGLCGMEKIDDIYFRSMKATFSAELISGDSTYTGGMTRTHEVISNYITTQLSRSFVGNESSTYPTFPNSTMTITCTSNGPHKTATYDISGSLTIYRNGTYQSIPISASVSEGVLGPAGNRKILITTVNGVDDIGNPFVTGIYLTHTAKSVWYKGCAFPNPGKRFYNYNLASSMSEKYFDTKWYGYIEGGIARVMTENILDEGLSPQETSLVSHYAFDSGHGILAIPTSFPNYTNPNKWASPGYTGYITNADPTSNFTWQYFG